MRSRRLTQASRLPCGFAALQVSNVVLARAAKLCNFVDWKVGPADAQLEHCCGVPGLAAGSQLLFQEPSR